MLPLSPISNTDTEKTSKCDICVEEEFKYFCDECEKYFCIECNKDCHKRGQALKHNRYEVYSRQAKQVAVCCSAHTNHELTFFCKTCNHAICNACVDLNGSHKKHDFILCSSMADTLIASADELISKIALKEGETYETLEKLEMFQYQLGAPGVFALSKVNTDELKHITSRELAISKVNHHYESIINHTRLLQKRQIQEIEDIVKMRSDAWTKHAESLHMNLVHLDRCVLTLNELKKTTAKEICANYSHLIQSIHDLDQEWICVDITNITSNIHVSVRNSILVDIDKSCYIGGLPPPSHAAIVLFPPPRPGFEIQFTPSVVENEVCEVSFYEVEIKMSDVDYVGGESAHCANISIVPTELEQEKGGGEKDDGDTALHVYSVVATASEQLGLSNNDPVFFGRDIYALVRAVDGNGSRSEACASNRVQVPEYSHRPMRLTYVSDFDKNGALYFIGTAGGTRAYINPHVSGDVVVTWSSKYAGEYHYFVENEYNKLACATNNSTNAYMMVDLGASRRIALNYYSLRHDNYAHWYRRHWNLEGKIDDSKDSTWTIIKEHVMDTSINQPGGTASWPIVNPTHESYRYIRVRTTGKDSDGYTSLRCCGIELYGELFVE